MKYLSNKIVLTVVLFTVLSFISCVQDNLDPDNAPNAGDVIDLTAPKAAFSFQQDVEVFTEFLFINESSSSTTQIWSIPDDAVLVGEDASLMDQDITVEFSGEGSFLVGLIASDQVPNPSEELVQEIVVLEPEIPLIPTPEIVSPGFEESDAVLDSRNPWGRNDAGNVNYNRVSSLTLFGQSGGSRVRTGSVSAKFDDDKVRQAYQEIAVTPNTNYRVSIYIRKGSTSDVLPGNDNEMRLAILGETFDAYDETLFENAIFASVEADPRDEFSKIFVDFNSGDLETVVIYMDSKATIETQVDDVEIAVL